MKYFLPYLAIINVIAIVVYGCDKLCAIQHRWRVPEKTLLAIAVVGGSLGACLRQRMETSLSQIGLEIEIPLSILVFGRRYIIRILIMANSPQLEINQD